MIRKFNDKNITQIFIDQNYKLVPVNSGAKCITTCFGYDSLPKCYSLILVALFPHEEKETFTDLNRILRDKYNFHPEKITFDFQRANINAIEQMYPKSTIVTCFFHFVKALWTKASKLGLRQKKYKKQTKKLILKNIMRQQ